MPVTADGEPVVLRVRRDAGGAAVELGDVVPGTEHDLTLVMADEGVIVLGDGRQTWVRLVDPLAVDPDAGSGAGGSQIKAPMHGKLIALFVKTGDRVEKGQRLAIVEAMKMEHVLTAPRDGVVIDTTAEPGMQVAQGARLISIGDAA
jgi:3-methylcrotonyl-CoA carboxylase alpha subunit